MAWILVNKVAISDYHQLELWLEEAARSNTDALNNRTRVNYEVGVRRISDKFGGFYSSNPSTATLKVNGSTISIPNFTYDFRNYNYLRLTGDSTDSWLYVSHSSDGSKTVSTEASANLSGSQFRAGSTSGSLKLSQIPRETTIKTFDWFYLNLEAIPFTLDKKHSSYTHWIQLKINNKTFIDSPGWTSASGSISFDSTSLARALAEVPNGTSINATLHVWTYRSSTQTSANQIGTVQTKTVKAWVHEDEKPSFTDILTSETSSTVSSVTTELLQHLSKIKITLANLVPGVGAKIKDIKIRVDGQVGYANGITTNPIKSSGQVEIKAVVTDSRDRTYESSKKITVLPYAPPTIQNLSLFRSTSSGEVDFFNTSATLVFDASFTKVGTSNSADYKIESKVIGGTYSIKESFTSYADYARVKKTYGVYDLTKEYQFRITLKDKFVTSVFEMDSLFLPVAGVNFFIGYGGTASSFGKMPTYGDKYNAEFGTKGIHNEGPYIDKFQNEILGVEYGGNSNASWEKHPDGTLYQTVWFDEALSTVTYGSGHYVITNVIAFPISFIDREYSLLSNVISSYFLSASIREGSSRMVKSCQLIFWSFAAQSGRSAPQYITFKGRWKV